MKMIGIRRQKENLGEDDLQMQEAVNILKDMIMLHARDQELTLISRSESQELLKSDCRKSALGLLYFNLRCHYHMAR